MLKVVLPQLNMQEKQNINIDTNLEPFDNGNLPILVLELYKLGFLTKRSEICREIWRNSEEVSQSKALKKK